VDHQGRGWPEENRDMPRPHRWLWFLASGLACSLSVDDPEGSDVQRVVAPPTGDPFGMGSSLQTLPAGAGTGGSRAPRDEPDAEGNGGANSSGRGGQAGERLTPWGLPVPDAGLQCPADAGSCGDTFCVSNDDCYAGLCVNARCRSFCEADGDCARGQACALGLCRTSPSETWECFVAGDCSLGEDCVSGGCLSRCSNDDHCSDSDDGAVCSLGYCGLS
jgi:hypothetical protein